MMKAYLQVSGSLLRGEDDLVRVRLNGEWRLLFQPFVSRGPVVVRQAGGQAGESGELRFNRVSLQAYLEGLVSSIQRTELQVSGSES